MSVSFSTEKFDPKFQAKVMQALLIETEWAEQMMDIIKPQYFDLAHLQFMATKYFAYYEKYRAFPTPTLLQAEINQALKKNPDAKLEKNIERFYFNLRKRPDLRDMPGVKDQTKDFCKKQAMQDALDQSLDLIKADRYSEVIPIMQRALIAGEDSSLGHHFRKDREARWQKDIRHACPTGVPELDTRWVLDGGVGKGELAVFAASKGVGKSHWLVNVGASALARGLNVLHYTFELRAEIVGLRYDSWLCDINSKEVVTKKDEVKKKYKEMDEYLGELIIRKYPIRAVSCNTIRAHIQRLKLREDFLPDIIIVDYADNMRGKESYDVAHTRFELKRIYEDLRNLAFELDVPVWTASQLNKEGSKDEIATIEHMAESFGKADDADIILTVTMDLKKKLSGFAKLYVAKSRAGEDGQVFDIHIDRSRSKFNVISADDLPDPDKDEEKKGLKTIVSDMKAKRAKESREANKAIKEAERAGAYDPKNINVN